MKRSATILLTVAVALCGLFALTQASSALSTMPEMDAACFSQCLDRALHDVANPSSAIIAAAFIVIAAVWSFAVPILVSRLEVVPVLSGNDPRLRRLSQRRE